MSFDRTTSGLRVDQPADGVRRLTLDRPGRMNALDVSTVEALTDELEALAEDDTTGVVVITGANGAFSAGADFDSLDLRGEGRDDIEALMHVVMRIGPLVHALPQPTIAVIHGPAAGAGLSLALACDLRVAASDARFLCPFVHMGLVPDCGATWLLPRLIGDAAALELMLTGRPVDAARALRLGLATHVADDPVTVADDLARAIVSRPPDAVRTIKHLVRGNAGRTLLEAVEREAVAQADAFAHPEFGARLDRWRTSRTPD